MNIERGPRKRRDFTIVDNALLQDNSLSFGARGLGVFILSLPDGARVDIRTLAKRNPEGRQALARYAAELEAAGYLVRTISRGERGRLVTKVTMYETPQDHATLPTSLPRSWSKKRNQDIESIDDTFTFPQVAPDPVSPDSGQPESGQPESGETGSKYLKNLPSKNLPPKKGAEDDAQITQNHTQAVAVLEDLPDHVRPSRAAMRRLAPLVAVRLEGGWTPDRLTTALSTDLPPVIHRREALLRTRLDDLPEQTTPPSRPPQPAPECSTHPGWPAHTCGGCRADRLAAG